MNCKNSETELIAFLSGDLDKNQSDELTHHVESCPECKVKLKSLSGLMCEIRNLRVEEMPLETEDRVLSSLKSYKRKNLKELLMLRWRPAFSLMVVLVILAAGVFDRANESRITAMVEGPNAGMMQSTTCKVDFLSNRYRLDHLLAQSSAEFNLTDDMEGGGTL